MSCSTGLQKLRSAPSILKFFQTSAALYAAIALVGTLSTTFDAITPPPKTLLAKAGGTAALHIISCSLEQPKKAAVFIFVSDAGKSTLCNAKVLIKALFSIEVTVEGTL